MAGRFGRRGKIMVEEESPSLGNREQGNGKLMSNRSDKSDEGMDELVSSEASIPDATGASTDGCLACSQDDDHANLILCDCCNDEYHIYCLDPPLRNVPTGDWFCDKCRPVCDSNDDDGLERMVSALSPAFTSRFGEIVWAAGGVGFGWWPACIYDPRLTVGSARELARKNLGKRHLVYFFECHEAPFSVMVNSRLVPWGEGLSEDYHLGKGARSAGKNRSVQFEHALQAAIVENDKPVEMRLEWNHPELPQVIPSPKRKRKPSARVREAGKRGKKRKNENDGVRKNRHRQRSKPMQLTLPFARVSPNRSNLDSALAALAASATANEIESLEDGELYLRILKKNPPGENGEEVDAVESVGFVRLESRLSASFAAARLAITEESIIDPDSMPQLVRWKFYIPTLGPMSVKQEAKVGPMLEFLRNTTSDARLGNGSIRNPLKVIIMGASTVASATPTSQSSAGSGPKPAKSSSSAAAAVPDMERPDLCI